MHIYFSSGTQIAITDSLDEKLTQKKKERLLGKGTDTATNTH